MGAREREMRNGMEEMKGTRQSEKAGGLLLAEGGDGRTRGEERNTFRASGDWRNAVGGGAAEKEARGKEPRAERWT